jgi:hypothetical protein
MTASKREPTTVSLIAMLVLIVGTCGLLGALSASLYAPFADVLAQAALGLVFGAAGPVGLASALIILFPRATRRHGWRTTAAGVMRGFLLLIPYAVLAVLARSLLRWEATAAFTAAGLMTACAAIGAEIGRLGGRRLTAMLLPMLAGSALSAIWVGATSALAALLAGGLL